MPEWRELQDADPQAHIFSTPLWNELWWGDFGEDKQLAVLTFVEEEPVAVAPLMLDRSEGERRVRFVGGDDLTDYLGPLMKTPELSTQIADSLLDFLSSHLTDWDRLDLKCLPVPFGFADALVERADRKGLHFETEQTELAAILALTGSFEDYVAQLPQKKRHELRRKMRRFHREEPGAVLRSSTPETLDADIELFVKMHRGSEGLKGKFMLPQRASFFEKVARAFDPLGWLSLDFLEVRGKPVATTFSFVYRDVFYLYNSAYDPNFRDVSPGLMIVAKLIERCIAEGIPRFDFLRGRERYKFDMGAQAIPLHSVQITKSSNRPTNA